MSSEVKHAVYYLLDSWLLELNAFVQNVHKKLSAKLEQSKKLWYFLLPQYFSTIKKKKASEFLKNLYFCFIDYAKAFDCVDHSKLWKILKEMRVSDHLTWLLRSLYVGHETTARIKHGRRDWFQIGKGGCQGYISSPCLFNLYAVYMTQNARLDEAQTGIKIAGININNLRYADDTTLMAESEELKSLLMKVKEESENVGLKLNTQKTKIMASGLILPWHLVPYFMANRWGNSGNSDRPYFWITADGDCSHEIKIYLLLGRKVMTNLDSMLKKQRHYFANKGPSCQRYGFSSSHAWMWELDYKESWAQKNWCFWTVMLEKTWESLAQQGDPTSQS